MKRLLITGAAGGLGRVMRGRLAHLAETIRLSDIAEMNPAGDGEEVIRCDLADAAGVMKLVEGCDGIVHFGGISVEDRFSRILRGNIEGVFNLYEAARVHGHPRIVFASSNHAIGYHEQTEHLSTDCTLKPDGLYGVSKCFGEAMASMYHSKFGQETAIVRIGSCFDKPADHRMLATWLSHDDLTSLIECCFRAPRLGCPVVWGCSANAERWWDNSAAAYLGWTPKDSSDRWRAEIDAACARPAPEDPAARYQGGRFTENGVFPED